MAGRSWTESELSELRSCYAHERAQDIAERIGRTPGSVRRMAGILGIRKENYEERLVYRFEVNRRAFHELTAATAYVLGLFVADGSLSGDRMKITNNDLDIMQAVRTALGSNHFLNVPKRVDDRTYSLVIRNSELTAGLRLHGITENKSLIGGWPTVSAELFPHVLRGYFDGDGHAGYGYKAGLRVKFTSGSPTLLNALARDLHERLGVPLRAFQSDKGRANAHRLWYYGANAAAIGKAMYAAPGIHMPRKRQPFLAYETRLTLPRSGSACRRP